MADFSQRSYWGEFLLLFTSTVGSANSCGCKIANAESFSERGNCVVRESDTSFCALNWRHGDSSSIGDQRAADEAENRARKFIESDEFRSKFADLFSNDPLPSMLENSQRSGGDKIYVGAAAYLETTRPEDYTKDQVIGSIIILMATVINPKDVSSRASIISYISSNSDRIFERMYGKGSLDTAPAIVNSEAFSDFSTYGCFEVRRLTAEGVPDLFRLRIGVRTHFAEDSLCLRR